MSNNLRLEVLLKTVDQATRPLKSIQTASKTLSGDIRDIQKGLRDLNGQASKIDGFRKASAQLAVTSQAPDKAKREAGELAVHSYIPATSSLGGYQVYQPVTAPDGRTYINQSSPTYQINLLGGGAPGGQSARHPVAGYIRKI